jgi:hypothetical protein
MVVRAVLNRLLLSARIGKNEMVVTPIARHTSPLENPIIDVALHDRVHHRRTGLGAHQ